MAKDSDISSRMNRLGEIGDQLDTDEVSLGEESNLYAEGQELLDHNSGRYADHHWSSPSVRSHTPVSDRRRWH